MCAFWLCAFVTLSTVYYSACFQHDNMVAEDGRDDSTCSNQDDLVSQQVKIHCARLVHVMAVPMGQASQAATSKRDEGDRQDQKDMVQGVEERVRLMHDAIGCTEQVCVCDVVHACIDARA